jgi:hypothetical protein
LPLYRQAPQACLVAVLVPAYAIQARPADSMVIAANSCYAGGGMFELDYSFGVEITSVA